MEPIAKELKVNISLKKQILILSVLPVVAASVIFAFIYVSNVMIITSLVIIAATMLAAGYVADRLINQPIDVIIRTIRNTSNDLSVKVPVTTGNEIGELANWLNRYTDDLNEIIRKVSDTVMGINAYASEIAAAVEQQAATASEQSAAVSEITSTMEELSVSSTQIAEHSSSVVDIATRTWEDTKKGAVAVETVMMKMSDINNDNQNSISEIVDLGKKSKEISKVMEIINTIADQTKLIAFNAALEASSAGEAGKRFGVVAVEIRRLADSVMESTGEIENKVNEIQQAIDRLVISSEKGSKGIQEGITHSSETASLLMEIVDAAQSTANAAKQISLSTQQQKTASNQVVGALREIVSGSGQTTNSINQIKEISTDLAGMSASLKGIIEKFKLKAGDGPLEQ